MGIKVNGREYKFSGKKKLLEVLQELNLEVPNFCYDSRLMHREESCGICVVEINGIMEKSCEVFVEDGMEIKTHSEEIFSKRKEILENIILNHPLDCLGCEKSGDCKLQEYCYEYGVHQSKNKYEEILEIDNSNPFYTINPNKCIACGKCVAMCKEQQCSNGLKLEIQNGKKAVKANGADKINFTQCMSCGNCVSVCPVGALLPKSKVQYRNWEVETVRTTCSYCGVGCQIDFSVKDNKIVEANPANIEPNDGLLCVKGKFGYKFVDHPDRLNTPLIRKNGKLEPATWEEAYEVIRENMSETLANFGSDAFGGLTSARCTNEDNYMFQKLFRAVLGTNNIDHCARL